MRPIVNMPEEDRATDIERVMITCNDHTFGSRDILVDRQTDALITIEVKSKYLRRTLTSASF